MEYSFGLLKPDCLERNLQVQVLDILTGVGLKVIICKQVRLIQAQIDVIYKKYLPEGAFANLSRIFLANDCIIYIVRGLNAINRLNDLVGFREPNQARKDTIRYKYGQSIARNIIHSTDNKNTFWQEAQPFLTELEAKRILNGSAGS